MDMSTELKRTDEQSHIVDLATSTSDNIMVEALAGTGKTTMCKMIYDALGTDTTYLVFNAANAKEAREERDWEAMTFNSCGSRAWSAAQGKTTVDMKKTFKLFNNIVGNVKPYHAQREMWDVYADVKAGVDMAKAIGYVPNGVPKVQSLASQTDLVNRLESIPDELTLKLIDQTLVASIKAAYAGSVDFNDQIYMPTLFGGSFIRNPLVLVDEWQDLNPINLAMLDRLAPERLVGVGDWHQGIYAFRGAQRDAIPYGIRHWNMTECTLSFSFRCPQAIVENARWHAPHYKWVKLGGTVTRPKGLPTIADGAAVICRNNAPLYKLAFQLLAAGRSVKVHGSDIGSRLLTIMRGFGDSTLSQSSVLYEIEKWYMKELAKESKTAADTAECMKIFANEGRDLGEILTYADAIMKTEGSIQLMTGHKSKGLEFDTVYFIEPQLIRRDEPQDLNLKYVIQTRSLNALVEVEPEDAS